MPARPRRSVRELSTKEMLWLEVGVCGSKYGPFASRAAAEAAWRQHGHRFAYVAGWPCWASIVFDHANPENWREAFAVWQALPEPMKERY